jgi:membrane fusion protein (multidrug efflux system)
MVLQPDSTVRVQNVSLGPQVDSMWVVDSGLHANDVVIVEGQQKVRPGSKVVAQPYSSMPPRDSAPSVQLPKTNARSPRDTSGD